MTFKLGIRYSALKFAYIFKIETSQNEIKSRSQIMLVSCFLFLSWASIISHYVFPISLTIELTARITETKRQININRFGI